MLTDLHALLGRINDCAAQLPHAPLGHAIAALIVAQILARKSQLPRACFQWLMGTLRNLGSISLLESRFIGRLAQR